MRPVALHLPMAGVLLAFTVAACGGTSSQTTASAPAPSTPAPSASSAGSSPSQPSPSEPSPSQPSPVTDTLVLSLRPDGLALLGPDGSTAGTLLFGQATDAQVDGALTRTIGAPARTAMDECGQGPRVASGRDRFSVLYADGRLVGWSDSGRTTPRLSAVNGLAVGSTLAAVQRLQPGTSVTTDSLGPEFSHQTGVSGMLDGTGSTSRVTLLYAGESCFFR